jgi:cytoskeletal protein RodZ
MKVMKKQNSRKNILPTLIVVGVMLAVSMACQLFGDSKYQEGNKTPLPLPSASSSGNTNKNDKSPTPTASATPTPSNSSVNNSTTSSSPKSQSYADNLPSGFRVPNDSVGKRIMSDYGALYVARGGVTPPPTAIFESADECAKWQATLKTSKASIGGLSTELQEPAMKDLQAAIAEAQSAGVTISPNGPDSSRRGYDDVIRLWKTRVDPALVHWVGNGKMTKEDAARIKALSPTAQVPEVLKLEEQGIYFDKFFSKSILYSVAAPGASQHLSMLALDVKEHTDSKVREILAKHNWYQTVASDIPHFTYLGVPESELPKLGLKKITSGDRSFWVPSL